MIVAMRSICLFLLLLSLPVAGKSQADGHLPGSSLAPQVESKRIPQRILVLDAYQLGLPIPESIERGLFAALRVDGFSVRNVFMEHLDFSRNPGSEVRSITVNLLRHKFSDKPVDIVIAIGAQTTDFMSREGKSLFPDAMVLTLISSNYMILSDDYDKVMAIPWQVDHAGTLESALELFPETQQVFVVTGANDRILSSLDEAKKAFGSWEGKLNFEYSNKMAYEEMLRRVASLPKDTIVIYTPFFSDSTGRTFVPAEVVVDVCKVSNSPVFATLDEYLGSGIVGGSLLKTEDIGKNAAKIVLDYLSGQIKLTEPVTTFATSPLVAFDWRELTRWKVDHFPRPEGSVIINRPLTLWGQYKTPVIAAVISFLLLTSLLIALLFLNRRLQRAKDEAIVNEMRYREMIERAPEAIILYDIELKRIVDCNAKAEKLFGCSRQKLLQGGPDRFYPKKQPDQDDVITSMNRNFSRAMAGEELVIEQFIRSDDGRELVCEVRIVRLPYQDKKMLRGSYIDITEKKRVQEEIEISRAEFAAIFNSISDGILFVDAQRHIVRINPAFTRMFGYELEEIAGQTTQLIYADPDDYSRQGQARFNPRAKVDQPVFENEYRRKDGTTFPAETIGVHVVDETEQLLGYVGVIHDVSERKSTEGKRERLEAQLHQAQKIESIGQLAGGVAHDFNNMLGVILGHAEMALLKADPSSPLISDLEEIGKAAKRSADLTRQLLTFARKQVIAPKVLDLNETVAGTLKMLQRLIGENIQLSWNATANLWPVKIDPSQVDQILANLCVNARDAIAGIGKISIKTENRTMDESATSALPYAVVPGDYVLLSVSDDGCGMDKQVQTRIFEPFYTTKEIGSGTGLGLATVYGAVKQNHGFLTVHSEVGLGTVFNIYLPRTSAAVEAKQETAEKPLLRGTETVLLVEDDEILLPLVRTMLEESGYTVMAAATTELAQTFAREHSGPIHLLISDMIMPAMNGLELSVKLQPLRPDMKVLFLSGYTADIISNQGVIKEDTHFLQKPFSFEALTTKVREVLDDH